MTELIEAAVEAVARKFQPLFVPAMARNIGADIVECVMTAITDAGYRIVKDEPVAWLIEHPDHPLQRDADLHRLSETLKRNGWTETPLYAAPGDEK
jgi:hypothetical protein